jgi:hypothetical protein
MLSWLVQQVGRYVSQLAGRISPHIRVVFIIIIIIIIIIGSADLRGPWPSSEASAN